MDELRSILDKAAWNLPQTKWQEWAKLVLEENKRLREDGERLNWLDLHTVFVADGEYLIGPYKTGELRKMADDGIAIDKARILSKPLQEIE